MVCLEVLDIIHGGIGRYVGAVQQEVWRFGEVKMITTVVRRIKELSEKA